VGSGQHLHQLCALLLDHCTYPVLYQRESPVISIEMVLQLTLQTWYSAHLPINTPQTADRFGSGYNVSRVLNAKSELDEVAYHEYSPIYVTACLGMTYTIAFALTTAMLVHTALWHGPRIWRVVRNRKSEAPDIHSKLMAAYKDVPEWWYGVVFLVLFAMSIVCISVFDTTLPVWGLVVALLLPVIYFLPAAFIFATTAQIMTLNLVAQIVPGFMLPGRPLAVMVGHAVHSRDALMKADFW
jgi:OPT family oligopeptide transporter